MYGASIERDFPHIAYEQEQLKRRLELRRVLESDQPQPQRPRRSLATFLGQVLPRLEVRIAGRRSSAIPSS